jgi:uncharacterized protein (TIGR01777 family)
MKIVISGSTGMVGTALVESLRAEGHAIGRLARPGTQIPAGGGASETWIRWNPSAGEIDAAAAENADAVVHLAGASIGDGRWTESRKAILRSSRVDATRNLVRALGRLKSPPKIFISASAIGYYGDRGEEELIEESAPGNDFLAKLCCDWEAESGRAEEFAARTVITRFGIILSKRGGALPRMLLPFRMGVGGRLGTGKQWMSWITLADTVGIIRATLDDARVRGPVNVVTPNPVRNSEFTAALARVLRRPAIFPAPGFALRLVLGDMAQALLLSGQRVLPEKLRSLGYGFKSTDLSGALRETTG